MNPSLDAGTLRRNGMNGGLIWARLAALFLVSGAACVGGAHDDDGAFSSIQDAAPEDSGTDAIDAGGSSVDGGVTDSGVRPHDAGPIDTGIAPDDAGPIDGGAASDAGFVDSGGRPDVGFVDSGVPLDAGAIDSGVRPDAGRPDAGASTPDAGVPDSGVDAGTPDAGTPDSGVVFHKVTLVGAWDSYFPNTGTVLNRCPMPQSGIGSCTLLVSEGAWLSLYKSAGGHCYNPNAWVQCSQGTGLNYCNLSSTLPWTMECESQGLNGPVTFVSNVWYSAAVSLCGQRPTMCLPSQSCGFHGTAYCGICPMGDICVQDIGVAACLRPAGCP